MQLLYCDESNLEERSGDFLIYGGVFIEADEAFRLSSEIDVLRKDVGVDREFKLKFNPRPEGLSHQEFLQLKQNIIELSIKHGARFLSYVILHDVSKDPNEARRNGINRVCYNFNSILKAKDDHGLVLIDRFNDGQIDQHLSRKFSTGIEGLPYTPVMRLQNIMGFHYSAIGQAHFPSIVDIVVGSFRFAVNAYTRDDKGKLETAQKLLKILSPIFYRETDNVDVSKHGLALDPKIIRSQKFFGMYKDLQEFLKKNGIKATQTISNK